MSGFTCADLDAEAMGVLDTAIASVLTGVDTESVYFTRAHDSANGGCEVAFVVYCDHDSEEGMVSELQAAATSGALDDAVQSEAEDSGVAALEDASVEHIEYRALEDDESSGANDGEGSMLDIPVLVWVFAGIIACCFLCNCVVGSSAVSAKVKQRKDSQPMQQTSSSETTTSTDDTSQDLSFRMGSVNPMRKPPRKPPRTTAAVV